MSSSHFSRCSADKGSHGASSGRILPQIEGHFGFVGTQSVPYPPTTSPNQMTNFLLLLQRSKREPGAETSPHSRTAVPNWSIGWVSCTRVKMDACCWCRGKQHCSKAHMETLAQRSSSIATSCWERRSNSLSNLGLKDLHLLIQASTQLINKMEHSL